MPKITKSEATNGRVWWVNYTLSDLEIRKVEEAGTPLQGLFDSASTLVEDGYRLTFGLDAKSSATLVCLFSPDDHPNHPNQALSSRSSDLEEAFAMCLFKHYEVFGEKWPPRDSSKRSARG